MQSLMAVMGATIAFGVATGPCIAQSQIRAGGEIPPGTKTMEVFIVNKGMPYSGVRVVKNVFFFPDGGSKTETARTKEWRDNEGRHREDITPNADSDDVGDESLVTVCKIEDPIEHVRYTWKLGKHVKSVVTETHYEMDGIQQEIWGDPVHEHKDETGKARAVVIMPQQPSANGVSKTVETLGPEYLNGVYAEGSRSTRIIQPHTGKNQTDHEITLVDELWMAPDLKMYIKMLHVDLSDYTEEVELKDIDRSNPDPSVFRPPPGMPRRMATKDDPVWTEPIG